MKSENKTNILNFVLLVTIGIGSRLIPHPWNFTGITAMALFSGLDSRRTKKNGKLMLMAPLAALFFSDLILGLHNTMVFTYLALSVIGLLSSYCFEFNVFNKIWTAFMGIARKKSFLSDSGLKVNLYIGKSVGWLSLMSLAASLIFFLITNFGVWFVSGMYEASFKGLFTCYVAGIPFLGNQILGDLFYSSIFALAFYSLTSLSPVEAE